jgi:F0F1-type ATP synthase assembly protein I
MKSKKTAKQITNKKTKQTAKQPDSKSGWMRYLGLASQLMVALALSVWAGIVIDKRLGNSMPLLVWILPLLIIAVTIFKLVKETGNQTNGKNEPGE